MLNSALPDKLRALPWFVILTVVAIGGFGLLILYSAAGGEVRPWAMNQGIRFAALLCVMLMALPWSRLPVIRCSVLGDHPR